MSATTPGIAATLAAVAGSAPAVAPLASGALASVILASAVLARPPLLTNPSTPWPPKGAGNLCAFTVRSGSESAATVYSAAPLYLVTTSTCPSNSTQSPGRGR